MVPYKLLWCSLFYFKVKTLSFWCDVFQTKILWFGGKFIDLILEWILEILECYTCMSEKLRIKLQHWCCICRESVNECTIRHWYANFETGYESLTNEDRGRPETVVDNAVLRAIVKKIQAILIEIMQKNKVYLPHHFTSSNIDCQS